MKKRKVKILGHIIMYNKFITNIFEGKAIVLRGRKWPRKTSLEDIKHFLDFSKYGQGSDEVLIGHGYYKLLTTSHDGLCTFKINNHTK